jgi:hypothetical protein
LQPQEQSLSIWYPFKSEQPQKITNPGYSKTENLLNAPPMLFK